MRLIDSSTIVKFFSLEPGWEAAKEYVRVPVTIELALKELANALWKKTRRGQFEADAAVRVLREFDRIAFYFDQGNYIIRAFGIAVSHNLTIYDSLFIAAASVEGCELVTSDEKQAYVSKKEGIHTIMC
jgi:predicted nucleic acid-binding protein